MTSEGETLILKTKSTKIRFDEKIANNGGKGLILATKFYKNPNDATLLVPNNHNPEVKVDIEPEGVKVEKQEQMATIQQATWKVHINELHKNLIHSGEDKMHATVKHIHYIVKGTLEVCEDFSTVKINHK